MSASSGDHVVPDAAEPAGAPKPPSRGQAAEDPEWARRHRHRRRRPRRWSVLGRRTYAIFGGLGVVVGALAGTLALAGDIGHLFKGDPPAAIDARIDDVVQTRARMPFGEYLDVVKLPRKGFSAAQLAQPGYQFTVTVTITGRVGAELPLRFKVFRVPETPLAGSIYDREAVGFEPEGQRHSDSWPVWVPYPPRAGRYFVRFTLEDERGLPANERDTARFSYPPR